MWIYLLLAMLCFVICFLLYMYSKIINTNNYLNGKLDFFEEENEHNKSTISSLRKENSSLLNKVTSLEKELSDIKRLYPDVDSKLSILHDKEEAKRVDSLIQTVINQEASAEIFKQLKDIFKEYILLSKKQKTYITSDISKFRKLYTDSAVLHTNHIQSKKFLDSRRKDNSSTN